MTELTEKDLERFWAKVDKSGECWVWTSTCRAGYGIFGLRKNGKGTTVSAHRLSYELHYEPPGKLFVCHRCDNPKCIRPEHLFLGTHTENMRDMMEKGRSNKTALTNEIVSQARLRAAQGENASALAKEYGVDRFGLIGAIRGETFGHIEEPPVPRVDIYQRRKPTKLSHDDVQEILKELEKPYWGQVNDLAKKYGVGHARITQIKTGYYLPVHFNRP